tara:strand:- start:741 stop:1484 length:744 start_codon:yes stop_codon:yes gene_type:complete
MSLNHFVDFDTSNIEELDCYCGTLTTFNNLITKKKIAFDNGATDPVNYGYLSVPLRQDNTAQLIFNNWNVEQPINNSYQRFFQQMVSQSAITQPLYTQLINRTNHVGELPVIPANTTLIGTSFKINGHGTLSVPSANSQAKLELYFNFSLIATTDVFTLPNLSGDTFFYFKMRTITYALGEQGTIKTFGTLHFVDKQGGSHDVFIDSTNDQTYSTEEDVDIFVRWTWVTQNPGQLLILTEANMNKLL